MSVHCTFHFYMYILSSSHTCPIPRKIQVTLLTQANVSINILSETTLFLIRYISCTLVPYIRFGFLFPSSYPIIDTSRYCQRLSSNLRQCSCHHIARRVGLWQLEAFHPVWPRYCCRRI